MFFQQTMVKESISSILFQEAQILLELQLSQNCYNKGEDVNRTGYRSCIRWDRWLIDSFDWLGIYKRATSLD